MSNHSHSYLSFEILGTVIAVVISYAKWQSIGWAILHGLLSWIYVIYYCIKY